MRASRRIRIRAFAWCLAVVLAVCAAVFLSLALYLHLARHMTPSLAALVTGAALLALTTIVLASSYWITSRRGNRRRRRADNIDGLEELLESHIDPLLRGWIDRHPEGAAASTLLLGIAAGYSRSVRRLLQEFYDNYAETERRRRENDRA